MRANLIAAMRRDATLRARAVGRNARTPQSAIGDPVVAAGVRGPVTDLLEGLGPAHVDEVPLPVVALGGVASLLLLAGLGAVARPHALAPRGALTRSPRERTLRPG